VPRARRETDRAESVGQRGGERRGTRRGDATLDPQRAGDRIEPARESTFRACCGVLPPRWTLADCTRLGALARGLRLGMPQRRLAVVAGRCSVCGSILGASPGFGLSVEGERSWPLTTVLIEET